MVKEDRPGWDWVETGSGGFWTKQKGPSHSHKLDFFCPHCKRITGTIDDKYLEEYGFCAECYVMYVDERSKPAIDLSKYKKK